MIRFWFNLLTFLQWKLKLKQVKNDYNALFYWLTFMSWRCFIERYQLRKMVKINGIWIPDAQKLYAEYLEYLHSNKEISSFDKLAHLVSLSVCMSICVFYKIINIWRTIWTTTFWFWRNCLIIYAWLCKFNVITSTVSKGRTFKKFRTKTIKLFWTKNILKRSSF